MRLQQRAKGLYLKLDGWYPELVIAGDGAVSIYQLDATDIELLLLYLGVARDWLNRRTDSDAAE